MKNLSGDIRIDGILSYDSAVASPVLSWVSSNSVGSPVSLTYGFLSAGTYGVSNFQQMNSNQRNATEEILQMYENVANVSFTQVSAAVADISFGTANLGGSSFSYTAGIAYTSWSRAFSNSHSWYVDSDVYITNASFAGFGNIQPGDVGYETLMHEIGHGLGLGHPFEDQILPNAYDSTKFTVMSYNEYYTGGTHAAGLMLLDILAVQYLYGANTQFNAGDTTIDLSAYLSAGPKALWDGGGNDTLDLSGFSSGKSLRLIEGDYSSLHTTDDFVIAYGANIEGAVGTAFADSIVGTGTDNSIYGGNGNDALFGLSGEDVLYGGSGNDNIYGNAGNDGVLSGGEDNDYVSGGYGDDSVFGNAGTDTLYGGDGNDFVFGGTGNDLVMNGGNGNDYISAAGGTDSLFGMSGNDTLFGGDQEDYLSGGSGIDRLFGGSSADRIFGGNDNDFIYSGAGQDVIVNGGEGDDYISGGEGLDGLYGFLGNDTIFGGLGDDLLTGISGNDRLYGDEDNDRIYGGDGTDTMEGGSGVDAMNGGNDNDTMYGGDGGDYLLGAQGNDILQGDKGNDALQGGVGNDQLTGGEGSDTFIFGSNEGTDTITDFAIGTDSVRVSGHSGGIGGLTSFNSAGNLVVQFDGGTIIFNGLAGANLNDLDFSFI